ncbi:MAG: DUF4834 family protein [Tenacibaculum sp.]|nr:DUF4834 family protein [Tenacibaculum sp.]
MVFLKTLLYIVLIYYVVKVLIRIFAPYLIKKAVDKMQQKAQQQYQNNQQPEVKEGEVVIDKKPNNINKSNNDVGEYVDFEEVE